MNARSENCNHRLAIAASKGPACFFGLFSRRFRWGLSARGFIVFGFSLATVFVALAQESYPFLAITNPVPSDTLVVEGWINEYSIRQAAAEYARGHYRHLFTTGGPTVGKGGYINDYNTSASVGAELLKRAGIPPESVQMVPSRVMDRDRTYSSAIALRDWLDNHDLHVTSVNIVTESCHARRTRLLFHKALGPDVMIGVIAISSPDYDATHWWRYSEGVEEVIGETIAYVYAKFFFHPSETKGS
jgi:uncharacterized SAM-binding protein YcdF (DUF218 family)